MSDDPKPGTTASVDARVERLENTASALQKQGDALKDQVDGLDHKFDSMTTDLALLKQAQDHISVQIHSMTLVAATESQLQGQRWERLMAMFAEPTQTPMGRQIVSDNARHEHESADIHLALRNDLGGLSSDVQKVRLWVASASAVVGVIVVALNILAPLIQHALNIKP